MKIAITGSTGYIGQRLHNAALRNDHQVICLSRCQSSFLLQDWIKYDLDSKEPLILPTDIEAIVHLAAKTSFENILSEDVEFEAAKKLVDFAKNNGIKLIFISSQTARSDAPTAYGRIKFKIEEIVIGAGGAVIRPGLVYGGQPKGLYGELVRLVKKFYFLPLFIPGPQVQPIHVDDLAAGILKVIELNPMNCPSVIKLGSIEPISFSRFLGGIARYHLRVSRFYIPIPSVAVSMLAGIFSKLGGGLNRINSLFNLVVMDTHSDLSSLDLKLRALNIGLHAFGSNNRRELLLEGHAFHSYLVGMDLNKIKIRHYVRIVEQLRDGMSLQLPCGYQFWPFMIALFDDKSLKACPWIDEYKWRLRAATLISEASLSGAINFLGAKGAGGFSSSFFGILFALLSEIFLKVCRFLLMPFIKLVFWKNLRCAHET